MKESTRLFLTLAIAFSLTGCVIQSTGPEPTAIATPITVQRPEYVVERGDVNKILQVSGRVTPIKQQNIFFATDGVVKEVLVASGDIVQEGTVLARLDAPERYISDVTNAQLELAEAKLKLEDAQLNAPIALAEAIQSVTVAQKVLLSAEAAYKWATTNLNEAGIAKAKNDLDMAQGEYNKAQAMVERISEGGEMSTIGLAELALAAAEAKFDLANQSLSSIELKAPFDGQIMSLGVVPGSTVKSFQVIMTLADPTSLEISALVDANQISSLAPGQAAQIRLSSHGDEEFTGNIIAVPMAQDGTNPANYDSRIHIKIEDGAMLKLGDSASIKVLIDTRENVLCLPPAAIRTFQGENFVIVEINGIQRRVNVILGLKSTDLVEVVSGLQEGQKIIGQ